MVVAGALWSLTPTLVLFFSYLLFLLSVYFDISLKPYNLILLVTMVGITVYAVSAVLRDIYKCVLRIHTWFKYVVLGLVLEIFFLFLLCGWLSVKPIHLPQETDVLVYHLFLPLQHLAAHSLNPIPWYWQEMNPMVIQWSMAPLFLAAWPPIKLGTFCIQVVLACQIYLISRLMRLSQTDALFTLGCWIFTQCVYLQLGTAMFDHVNLYFITSFIITLLLLYRYKYNRRHFSMACFIERWRNVLFCIAGLNVAYGVSTKNLSVLVFLLTTAPFILILPKKKSFREYRFSHVGVLLTLLVVAAVLLPCWLRIWSFCGNPIFPITMKKWFVEPIASAEDLIKLREQFGVWFRGYGLGRTWKDFLVTPLALGFSGNGINNRFDYPLGVPPYFCALGLGAFAIFPKRTMYFDVKPFFLFMGLIYISWWFICQQTRFLYPALFLFFLGTGLLIRDSRYRSSIIAGLLFWLFLNGAYPLISKYREERDYFFTFGAKRVWGDAGQSRVQRLGGKLRDNPIPLVIKAGGESRNALLGIVRLAAFDMIPSLLQSGDERDCDALRRELESARLKQIPVYGIVNNTVRQISTSEEAGFLHQYLACD